MTDDDRLARLLCSSLPPAPEGGPSRDLWPAVVDRGRPRRSWSWLDLAAAAVIGGAVISSPGWLLALAYYL